MKILTKELLQQLPSYEAIANEEDPKVWAKFFYPYFSWRWYVIAYHGKDVFFGFVDGDDAELGDFSLSELLNTRGKWGLPIERDRWFEPCRLSELRAKLGR